MKEKKRTSRFTKTLLASRHLLIAYVLLVVISYPLILIANNFIEQKYQITENPTEGFQRIVQEFFGYMIHPISSIQLIFANPPLKMLFLWLILGITMLVLPKMSGIYIRLKKHVVEDASDYGAHGTSRWSKDKEITEDKKNFITDIDDVENIGSLIGKSLYTNEYIIRKLTSRINGHTFVVAGSGKGKTQAYALNQILLNKKRSIVASDGKGELFRKCSKQKAKEGYKPLFIDFIKFGGNRWNPLSEMNFDEIDNFSTALVESADDDSKNVWGGQAINYISAVIAYALENLSQDKQTMTFVRKLMNLPEMDIKELFEDLSDDSIAKDYFSEVSGATGNVWDSIMITAKNSTRFWKQKRVQNFTSSSDFKFTDLGKEKIFLCIRIHPTDKTFEPLVNTFFTQMINTLIEEVDEYGGRYPVEIDFVLDEFTNAGLIPGFQGALSFIRALGLTMHIIVQDVSQVQKLYKEEDTRSMIANCDNFILLGTNEEEVTAKKINTRLGPTTKVIRNDNQKANDVNRSKDSQAYNFSKRDLMTIQEVLIMDSEIGIYIPSGKNPIKFKKQYAYNLFPNLEESSLDWHLKDRGKEESKLEPKEEKSEEDILKDFYGQEQALEKKETEIDDFNFFQDELESEQEEEFEIEQLQVQQENEKQIQKEQEIDLSNL